MDFEIPRQVYDADHEQFRTTLRQFITREVLPRYAEWEAAGQTPRDIWARAGDLGILGTSIPTEWGGMGGDFRFDAIVLEELGRAGVAAPAWDMHAYIIAPFLVHFGTDAQKADFLPPMVAGTRIAAIGLTEPGSGSDLGALRTHARLEGDHYVVNGSKTFITNGHIADFILLAVKTAPELGTRGISLLLVDTASAGFRRGRNLDKIGNHAQDTAELFFDDLRVPAERLLGGIENQGWRQLTHGLAQERMVVAVRSIAMAEAAWDQTLDQVRDRRVAGHPVLDFQTTRFRLAEMATQIEAGRPFIDRCIDLLAQGQLSPELAAKAKLWATELADQVLDECLQLHGGYGYIRDYPIARAWADARVHRIYAGTNEVMKHIISRRY